MLGSGEAVDLIILDLMMPREDAATTFKELRERRRDVPVLPCTGLPEADPAPELLGHPDVSLIRKPFRMNELWYAVKQALRRVDYHGGKETVAITLHAAGIQALAEELAIHAKEKTA